jgi:hypothetical protein
LPQYWGFKHNVSKTEQDNWLVQNQKSSENNSEEDDDVSAERKKALSNTIWPAVKVVNLRKEYNGPLLSSLKNRFLNKGSSSKAAVKNSSITFAEGEL